MTLFVLLGAAWLSLSVALALVVRVIPKAPDPAEQHVTASRRDRRAADRRAAATDPRFGGPERRRGTDRRGGASLTA